MARSSTFYSAVSAVLVAVAITTAATETRAQRSCAQKEATSWEITVADKDEPGDRLVVEGVVTDRKGNAIANAIVYMYQTDATGVYSPGNRDASVARLCGLMKTGADGRYRFTTIKPGSYPGSTVPAHVHYVVNGPKMREHQFLLEFEKDPYIRQGAIDRDRGEHEGLDDRYRGIRPLEKRDDTWYCRRDLCVTVKS